MSCTLKSCALYSSVAIFKTENPQQKSRDFPVLKNVFMSTTPVVVSDHKWSPVINKVPNFHTHIKASILGERWWEKSMKPNMVEIKSAKHLVDSLNEAGDRLVVVDFYSPACGGCKTLHPKVCQFAELYPDAIFLRVNQEEHKSMCYCLNIHVLPFFRFYRGAQGRLCSFSCTNATIKKFKDALAKNGTDGCTLGLSKGLEESELNLLASYGELQFNHVALTITTDETVSKRL